MTVPQARARVYTSANRQTISTRFRRFLRRKHGTKIAHKDVFTDAVMMSGIRSYMVMPGQPVWMDRNYYQFALEAYVRNVIAHRAMGMVSSAASSVEMKLYAVGPDDMRREIKTHPVLDLLSQPNPCHAQSEFFQALYQYKLISGNAFIQAVGPNGSLPSELHLLRPDRMAVIAGKGTMPAGYRYTVNGQATDFPVDPITGRSRILHVKNFHPLNDWYGLSAVEAAAYSIDQHNQSGAWNQALLQNGARPSGALVVKADATGGGTLSEEQYNRVKLQIDDQFTGAVNAGRPLLLEGGLDWKEMSLTPKDMDFVEGKNSAARDIALAFGVPPQLLGIPGDNTYANLQEARLALWEQTVVPLAKSTADALNSWLIPMFGANMELCPDIDSITVLAMRNQAIWNRVQNASFLTDDEKRAAVGYGPLEKVQAKSFKSSAVQNISRPAGDFSISRNGVNFIANHEAFSANAYLDDAGHPTIGYGHRLLPEEVYPAGIGETEARQLLTGDIGTAEVAVQSHVKVPLTQNQFDALTSLAYNIGAGNFERSTLLQHLNHGDYSGAAAQFAVWDNIKVDGTLKPDSGLVHRRNLERDMFLNGNYA